MVILWKKIKKDRSFAGILKELRLKAKFTVKQVSLLVGINYSTLLRYEKGTSSISSLNLIKLSKFYKVSTDYILGLKD